MEIVERLHIRPREDVVSAAHRLYTVSTPFLRQWAKHLRHFHSLEFLPFFP